MSYCFGKTAVSKTVACIATAALAASMTPIAAFADSATDTGTSDEVENTQSGEATGEDEGNSDEAQTGAGEETQDGADENAAQEASVTEVSDADQLAAALATGDSILLTADLDLEKGLTVSSDTQLNLGGHTLTVDGGSALDVYGNLVIDNGTVKSTNVTNAAVIWVNQSTSLTIASNATVEAPEDSFCVAYWSDCTAANVTINGKLTGANGVTVNGNIKDTETQNKLTVAGGSIEVSGHGIYQAGYSEVTIEDGSTINASATGIETRAGKLVVNGGTITGGDAETTCTANGGGTTVDNAGIAIAQHTTKLPIDVAISGGTITGTSAVYEANPQENDADSIAQVKLAISGGIFTGAICSTDLTGFITGGNFSVDPTAFVAGELPVTAEDNGTYTVNKTAEPTEPTEPAEPTEPEAPEQPAEAEVPSNVTITDSNPTVINGIEAAGTVSYAAPDDATGILLIPTTIEVGDQTYVVTSIADNAFIGNTAIEEIVIPDTVTSIGYAAFKQCSNLKSVEIPESVTTIDERAFSRCSALTSIALPNSITSIGQYAFYSDSNLGSIEIPANVESIGKSAFKYCTGLTEIAIPGSVKTVSKRAFQGCTGLASVTVPKTVETLGYKAFAGCSGITSATVKAQTIGERAFQNNIALKSVTIGDKVTSIGQAAFKNDVKLSSVTIGSKVSSIAKYAFNGTEKLAKITVTGNKLTKSGVKKSLKGSSVEKVVVDYSTASKNQKLADIYAGYFTKSNCGKKVAVKVAN